MMYGHGFSSIGGIVMIIFWVLIFVAIVWGVIYFGRKSGQSNSAVPDVEAPLDMIERLYADGEISEEQF